MPEYARTEVLPSRLRIQDVMLACLFGALVWFGHTPSQKALIGILGVMHLLEGKSEWLRTRIGRATLAVLQLSAVYLLIGISEGVNSGYYLLLLSPVISTATYAGVVGTVFGSVVAIGAYLSFLLYIDWSQWKMDPEAIHVLTIRCLLLAIAAFLVNALGEVVRRLRAA